MEYNHELIFTKVRCLCMKLCMNLYCFILISPGRLCDHLCAKLTLKVLVATIAAQWEGMGDVGSARYEPALLPPCPTIRV